eukprot:scaffold2753_cov154-Amphora_coffeaeformis.AAC.4
MFRGVVSHAVILVLFCWKLSFTAVLSVDAFQSSADAKSPTLLLPSISETPFTAFEKAEHARAYQEIRDSCQGCWSGSMSILGIKENNELVVKQPPLRNFRLQVDLKKGADNMGTWTVWNLMKEGDETVVPLRLTPTERPTQYKIGFAGIILRIPCAISPELPRIVLEIGFWDDCTRRTTVAEYTKNASSWIPRRSSEGPWCLDEASLVQMKRQPSSGFIGKMTDPRAIAFLPTEASFDIREWNWEQWQPTQTEKVALDFTAGDRTQHTRLDPETQKEIHKRVVQAFDEANPSNFVRVVPNSMLCCIPYRLDPTSDEDKVCAFFAHAWNNHEMVVIEMEYQGRMAKSASLYTFRKK